MPSNKQLFLKHLGQTSPAPLGIEIERAEGINMYDKNGNSYIDLVSGVSVSNLGHHHPTIIKAIKEQVDKYMHLMVYGEIVQAPQVKFAELLCNQLPDGLDSVYLVNSGSEAIDGAMKLAKRITGRSQFISCKNAYHGGTHGALSIMGSETFKTAFRPLLPDTLLIEFNNFDHISKITDKTAALIIEPIQGEGGIISPKDGYLQALRQRCTETGTMLIFDEIQTGFGRTGELFAFQKYNVTPDIMCIAKAMGGGMPIGGFVTSLKRMKTLTYDPVLGHITTFGGHPVSSAAAYAHLNFLVENPNTYKDAERKSEIFYKNLINHPMVKEIRSDGFFMAIDLGDGEKTSKMANLLLENGVVTDLFLFNKTAFRISPPLPMTDEEIEDTSKIIIDCLNKL